MPLVGNHGHNLVRGKKIHIEATHTDVYEIQMSRGNTLLLIGGDLKIDSNRDIIIDSSTVGRICYFDSDKKIKSVGAGTIGQVLQSDGDGTYSWVTNYAGDITGAVSYTHLTLPTKRIV